MKLLFRNAYLLFLSGFIGWLSTGCDKGSSNEATPQSGCRIQEYVATSKSGYSTGTQRTTYDYDTQGNLVKTVATFANRPTIATIGGQSGTTTDTYTYTADGYLTASTSEIVYLTTTDKTVREQYTTAKSYSYANGRLAGATSQFTTAKGTSTSASMYTYDNAGNLTQLTTFNPAYPTEYKTIYTYQKNELVDYVEKSGTSEKRPYTIQDGLITKMVFPGSSYDLITVGTFDNQKRMIKREEYYGDQLNQSDSQTWSDAKSASASLPLFKGFPPIISQGYLFTGNVGVLATRKQHYWNSISKTMELYYEHTSTVQANSQGYVSSVTTTSKHARLSDQNYKMTETYTYTGCQ